MKIKIMTLMTVCFAIFFMIACKKNQAGQPSALQNTITGKWTILTVTTIGHDSTGAVIPSEQRTYTDGPGNYFQFNTDGTWTEKLTDDPTLAGLYGSYALNTDTSFTLTGINGNTTTLCKVSSLSTASFVFSHNGPLLPNPAHYVEYIFALTK